MQGQQHDVWLCLRREDTETAMTKFEGQIDRLRGYNTPDRTIDSQRQMAVDIHEAADTLEALNRVYEAARLETAMCGDDEMVELQDAIAAVKELG